jgi:hypothetical protein
VCVGGGRSLEGSGVTWERVILGDPCLGLSLRGFFLAINQGCPHCKVISGVQPWRGPLGGTLSAVTDFSVSLPCFA